MGAGSDLVRASWLLLNLADADLAHRWLDFRIILRAKLTDHRPVGASVAVTFLHPRRS